MNKNLKPLYTFMESNIGKIIFSIILGLALSSLFNLKCVNSNCTIYMIPEKYD